MDRLIFSGAVAQKDLQNLSRTNREQWLAWIWQALELDEFAQSGLVKPFAEVQIQVIIDRERHSLWSSRSQPGGADTVAGKNIDLTRPFAEIFPLLGAVPPEPGQVLRRFSVTQLINFQRCPRQYYFDRMLKAPGTEERRVWNDAEAPEPPANLTATLKGAVIHRFVKPFARATTRTLVCGQVFDDVVSQRQAELAGRALSKLIPIRQCAI